MPRQPPQASVAQRRLPQTVNLVSHTMVRVHPGALRLSWSRRIGHCPPKAGIAGSSPAGSTAARFSLARAAACKAVR